VLEAKAPAFSAPDAERIAQEAFGVGVEARPLASERDQNFHLRARDGREAHDVINRMRDDGVLVGREGEHGNVLKIRPPLVIGESDADRLVEALDRVLGAL